MNRMDFCVRLLPRNKHSKIQCNIYAFKLFIPPLDVHSTCIQSELLMLENLFSELKFCEERREKKCSFKWHDITHSANFRANNTYSLTPFYHTSCTPINKSMQLICILLVIQSNEHPTHFANQKSHFSWEY